MKGMGGKRRSDCMVKVREREKRIEDREKEEEMRMREDVK